MVTKTPLSAAVRTDLQSGRYEYRDYVIPQLIALQMLIFSPVGFQIRQNRMLLHVLHVLRSKHL